MNNELGVFLEKLRGKVSLREVAKKSGLSHTYIRDLELGVNRVTRTPIRPTPETLAKLADAYDYSYEELMKKAGYIVEKKQDEKHPAEKLLEFIQQGMTNEEIKKRMDFFLDNIMPLDDEDVEEFMDFVRWQLSKKERAAASSKPEGP